MTQNVVKISALILFDRLLLVKMSSFTDIHQIVTLANDTNCVFKVKYHLLKKLISKELPNGKWMPSDCVHNPNNNSKYTYINFCNHLYCLIMVTWRRLCQFVFLQFDTLHTSSQLIFYNVQLSRKRNSFSCPQEQLRNIYTNIFMHVIVRVKFHTYNIFSPILYLR